LCNINLEPVTLGEYLAEYLPMISPQLNIADTDSLRLQLKFEPNLASHIYHKNRDRIVKFANPPTENGLTF
jgi:hypothetical protein